MDGQIYFCTPPPPSYLLFLNCNYFSFLYYFILFYFSLAILSIEFMLGIFGSLRFLFLLLPFLYSTFPLFLSLRWVSWSLPTDFTFFLISFYSHLILYLVFLMIYILLTCHPYIYIMFHKFSF